MSCILSYREYKRKVYAYMRPIHYEDYDKLSDTVMLFNSELILRFNLSLSRKDNDTNLRKPFHTEYKYASKYAADGLLTLRRDLANHYFTLDKVTEPKASIMIRDQDIILLNRLLNQIEEWFKNDTFMVKNKKLMIKKHTKPIILQGLANNQYIQFEPIPIVYENTGEQIPGIRVTLGDESIYSDINVDKLYAWSYMMSTFNTYIAASIMAVYLGRPPYGTNLYEFEDSMMKNTYKTDNVEGGIDNRAIPRAKSFFDKMKEASE